MSDPVKSVGDLALLCRGARGEHGTVSANAREAQAIILDRVRDEIIAPYVAKVDELRAAIKETHGMVDDDPDKLMRVDRALAALEDDR